MAYSKCLEISGSCLAIFLSYLLIFPSTSIIADNASFASIYPSNLSQLVAASAIYYSVSNLYYITLRKGSKDLSGHP